MDVHEKLSAMVKKIQEIDEISDEYDKLDDELTEKDKIKTHCLTQGAFNAADELEELVDDLTEEDFEEIEAALDEVDDNIESLEIEVEESEEKFGKDSTELIAPLHELAGLYHISERVDEEIIARKRILNILKKNPNESKVNLALAMRELVFSLVEAEFVIEVNYNTEANLIRHQLFSMYKAVFKGESDDDIDILIDVMQMTLKTIEEFEVMDEIAISEEVYNLMIRIDSDIFENKEQYYNLTPLNAAGAIVFLLHQRGFKSQAMNFLNEFPKLKDKVKFKR